MIIVTVTVTEECEGLITEMPRGHEYELIYEDYEEDGPQIVKFQIHDLDDDLTAAQEHALNTNPGVIRYTVEQS